MEAVKGNVEGELRELFEETRAANEQYASAEYQRGSGLHNRLQTIEDAILHLARSLDKTG